MSITSYTELKTFVADHLELDSDTESKLDSFIQLAEAELSRLVMSPEREKVATASTTTGTQTVSLPTDFLQARQLLLDDDYPLEPVTLNVMQGKFAKDSAQSKPTTFAIANQSIYLGPVPDAVYALTITYQAEIPALSDSNTSNWLLASHPDAYLWATIFQVEAYLGNDERLGGVKTLMLGVVEQVNRQGNRYRAAAPMRLRSPVVV